jgi:hypothetical protein
MGWDLPVRGFDALERVKTIAGWLGYTGLFSGLFGAFWAWLCNMTVWWPLFAAIGVGTFCYVKAGFLVLETKRLIRDQERFGATLGPAILATAQLVLGKEAGTQKAPLVHHVLKAEPGTYSVTGLPATLTRTTEYIPLRDAMRQAYERTLTGVLSGFANGQADGNPDEVLNWYA